MNRLLWVSLIVAGSYGVWGCEKKAPDVKPDATPAPAKDDHGHDHDHAHGDDHDHDHDHADGHDHGPTTQLGSTKAGDFDVKASRDGDIKAGSDAAIDAWITGGTGKPSAVRFWIGTEDAKGSVKAKAELEKDNWHTHVEVPSPLPEGAKLWIEIEAEGGAKSVASFALNPA